jgi:hypothetical protein
VLQTFISKAYLKEDVSGKIITNIQGLTSVSGYYSLISAIKFFVPIKQFCAHILDAYLI